MGFLMEDLNPDSVLSLRHGDDEDEDTLGSNESSYPDVAVSVPVRALVRTEI
jgi:hypothetical protein